MSQVAARDHIASAVQATETIALGLKRFASTRTKYDATKGIVIGFLVFLAIILLIVALDVTGWLGDQVRWACSCSAYVVSFLSAWHFGLKSLFVEPSPTNLALDIEQLHTDFRESLLSSVELRDSQGRTTSGSHEFVEAIEYSTALKLKELQFIEMFPWHKLRNLQLILAVVLFALLGLCFLPGLQLSQRLKRALFPFWEISAPSLWRIEVLSPPEPSTIVPAEQYVAFDVELRSFRSDLVPPEQAELEISERKSDGKGWQTPKRIPLSADPNNALRFSTTALVGRNPIRYRIITEDSQTTYRSIQPMERPKVLSFHWQITPPRYAGTRSEWQTSESGDLAVLKDSSLVLQIDVNQPLKNAIVSFEEETNGLAQTLVLKKGAIVKPSSTDSATESSFDDSRLLNQSWNIELPPLSSGRFQVRLESESLYLGEPIRNTFSPWYRLQWLEDIPPRLSWRVSDETLWREVPRPNESWIINETDILSLPCLAQDNLPLASLSCEWSRNGDEWQTLQDSDPSAWKRPEGADSQIELVATETRWDVLPAQLRVGDIVSVRWRATDLAGQTTYSSPIRLTLAESEFSRDRHRSLFIKSELVEPLTALSKHTDTEREAMMELIRRFRNNQIATAELDSAIDKLLSWVNRTETLVSQAEEVGRRITPLLPDYLDQVDVELTLRCLFKIKREALPRIRFALSMDLLSSKAEQTNNRWIQDFVNEKQDRAIQGLQEAVDTAKRLEEIYRSWMGLWLQTALAKDTTSLMNYQRNQVNRRGTDVVGLRRSQIAAQRYWDSTDELANRFTELINPTFATRLPEWQRWMSETRKQISDLCDEENPNSKLDAIRNRLEQDVNELKGIRWVFNYDSSLFWSNEHWRKELIHRQGGLGSHFSRLLQIQNQLIELPKNKELSTADVTIHRQWLWNESYVFADEPLRQMSERGSIHQIRTKHDPLFVSDMGLAWRAYEQVITKARERAGDLAVHTADLKLIEGAYRVLEAFHDMVEARVAAEMMRDEERVHFSSLSGEFDHYRIWQSIQYQIDWAHAKMKEAGFQDGLPDRYNALRWNETYSQAGQKINLRNDVYNPVFTSAAAEIEEVLALWRELDQQAEATVENARRILRRFAPTIPELAKKAAEETRELEQFTQQIAPDDQPRNLEQTKESVQAQKLEVNRRIDSLQKALIEQASSQDLLNQQARQKAKDSDRALEMINRLQPQTEQAVQKILESKQPNRDNVDQAIMSEQKLAQALESIAKHFEQTQYASEASQTPDSEIPNSQKPESENQVSTNANPEPKTLSQDDLQDAESSKTAELPNGAQDDYDRAEQLEKLSQSDARELIQQLEKELKSDKAMQRELNKISESNETSAAAELKALADKEQRLGQRLENEDPAFAEAKRQKTMQLRLLADRIDQIATPLFNQASQESGRSGQPEQLNKLIKLAQKLSQASQKARQVYEQSPASEIDQAASQVEQAIQNIKNEAAAQQEAINQAADKEPTDSRKPKDRLTEANNQQDSYQKGLQKSSTDLARQWGEETKRQKQRSDQLAKELERANQQRQSAAQQLKKRPDDTWANEALRRATSEAEQRLRAAKAAEQTHQAIRQEADAMSEQNKSVADAPVPSLEKPNPAAALASDRLNRANQVINQLADKARELAEPINAEPQTYEQSLRDIARQQTLVRESAQRVAQDVARSARHEQRLGSSHENKALQKQAAAIENAARGILDQTEKELGQAAKQSFDQEKQFSQDNQDKPIQQPLNRSTTKDDVDRLKQSQETLNQLSQSLLSGTSEPNTPPSDSQRATQQSIEKAQMLDSLDRSLFGPPSKSNPSQPNNSQDAQASQSNESQSNSSRQPDSSPQAAKNALQSSLRSKAQQLASSMNQRRLQSLRDAQQTSSSNRQGTTPTNAPGKDMPFDPESYFLPNANQANLRDWGRLRTQSAEQAVEGKRDSFDPEYDQAIQAYFRTLQSNKR